MALDNTFTIKCIQTVILNRTTLSIPVKSSVSFLIKDSIQTVLRMLLILFGYECVFWMLPVQAQTVYCVWYAIFNQSSSEFMVYAGNMNVFGLAGIMSIP